MASDIGSDIQLADVDRSHRVGDPKKARVRPREIIVKFATYRSRQDFYRRRTSLKDKGYQGVLINEDLTKCRSNLLFEARQLYKSAQLKGAWLADGNILVKDDSDKIQCVSDVSDLDKFRTIPPIRRWLSGYGPEFWTWCLVLIMTGTYCLVLIITWNDCLILNTNCTKPSWPYINSIVFQERTVM